MSDVSEAHRATTLNLVNLFFGLGGLATLRSFRRTGEPAFAKFRASLLYRGVPVRLGLANPLTAGRRICQYRLKIGSSALLVQA